MTTTDSPSSETRRTLPRRPILIGAVIVTAAILIAAIWFARRNTDSSDPIDQPRLPQVIYLAPADAAARDLYQADLDGDNARPLTDTTDGIEDFAVSPSGQQIAYSLNNADHTRDIWLLDLKSGETRPLTRCERAICTDPAWSPDETRILYQRQEFNTGADGGSWVWIVDVNTVATRLFFDDPQIHGADPVWSPDGRRVAVFDAQAAVIRVHDLETGRDTILYSEQGVSGVFSPDGSRLVFPVLVRGVIGQEFYTHLELFDFELQGGLPVTGAPDTPVEDAFAAWSPDGSRLALARRYLDSRYTAGRQIYLLDVSASEVTPLVVDPAYNHAGIRWDSSGQRLVFQRFSLVEAGAEPEIWVYDLESGELTRAAENAYLPTWMPG